MSEAAKLEAFPAEWKKNDAIIYVFWFDETLHRVASLFEQQSLPATSLVTARETAAIHLNGKTIIFAEHYPLKEKETALFQKLNLQEVVIWSALDEPLFKHFGGDKIIQLMKQLGMKETEAIQHNMISKAIHSAQEKIAKKVTFEQSAGSQADWLKNNLPA